VCFTIATIFSFPIRPNLFRLVCLVIRHRLIIVRRKASPGVPLRFLGSSVLPGEEYSMRFLRVLPSLPEQWRWKFKRSVAFYKLFHKTQHYSATFFLFDFLARSR
jgi:hypothetical protein